VCQDTRRGDGRRQTELTWANNFFAWQVQVFHGSLVTCGIMLGRRGRDEASGNSYDVFISHAGPQKANFAVGLRRELRRHGISAFLDEANLRLGDAADAEMEAALRSCSIVMVVLTLDFVRSSYCMEELHWALHPTQQHPAQLPTSAAPATLQPAAGTAMQLEAQLHHPAQQCSKQPLLLLPVFYHTSDLEALQQDVQRQLAKAGGGGTSAAELQRLQQATKDLAALCRYTGNRLDSQGK
jgi:TIR domain